MYLLDVNVWVALAFPAHVHHQSARAWFDGSPSNRPCHFCRVTQLGFLRIANNPAAIPHAALTQDQAWQVYDHFVSNPRVGLAEEPAALEGNGDNGPKGRNSRPRSGTMPTWRHLP